MNEIHVGEEHSPPVRECATENKGFSVRRPVVLTIAGFDPSSGAGVTADLKVFAVAGLYGMACITALTVQSTQGVDRVEPVAADTVSDTLRRLAADVTFSGIKIGMLASGDVAEAVAEFLLSVPGVPVVLDPVLRSSSGREMVDLKGLEILKTNIVRRVDWITPNLDELGALTQESVIEVQHVPFAAVELRRRAIESGNSKLNIVVTGGHLTSTDDYLLDSDGHGQWIVGERVATDSTHGTGCAFSSALLCELVRGQAPVTAARNAKAYVEAALRAAYPVGSGKGPMNHCFPFERPSTV
jgi:hydroxymethylpyrimidine/phosphomethylpyrimidine kinase